MKTKLLTSQLDSIHNDSRAIYRVTIKPSLTGIFVKEKKAVQKAIDEKFEVKDEEGTYMLEDNIELVTDDSLSIDIFVTDKLETGFNPFSQE